MSTMRLETIEEIFGGDGEQPVQEKKKIFVKIPENFETIEELEVIKHRERVMKHTELLRKLAEKNRERQEYAKRLFAHF